MNPFSVDKEVSLRIAKEVFSNLRNEKECCISIWEDPRDCIDSDNDEILIPYRHKLQVAEVNIEGKEDDHINDKSDINDYIHEFVLGSHQCELCNKIVLYHECEVVGEVILMHAICLEPVLNAILLMQTLLTMTT
jgi:hypothetical protein